VPVEASFAAAALPAASSSAANVPDLSPGRVCTGTIDTDADGDGAGEADDATGNGSCLLTPARPPLLSLSPLLLLSLPLELPLPVTWPRFFCIFVAIFSWFPLAFSTDLLSSLLSFLPPPPPPLLLLLIAAAKTAATNNSVHEPAPHCMQTACSSIWTDDETIDG
jgi:hypothetical protein